MMLVDKPSPGTGASLILEVISIIAIGQPAEMKSPPGNEEEWRKMITSTLREGPAL
jgi:putative DNA primase/helicase